MTGIVISAVMSMVGPGFGMLMKPWIQEEIGLTEDQADKLTKIISDHIASAATIRAEITARRLELRTELRKDNPDMNKVEKLAGEIGSLEAKLLMERIRTEIAIRNLLTKEQRAKLRELRTSKRGKGPGPMRF